jgi:hypothetical protein
VYELYTSTQRRKGRKEKLQRYKFRVGVEAAAITFAPHFTCLALYSAFISFFLFFFASFLAVPLRPLRQRS